MFQSSVEAEGLHSVEIETMNEELETTKTVFQASMADIPSSLKFHAEENCDIHSEDVEETLTSAEDYECSLDDSAVEQCLTMSSNDGCWIYLADSSIQLESNQQEYALIRVDE